MRAAIGEGTDRRTGDFSGAYKRREHGGITPEDDRQGGSPTIAEFLQAELGRCPRLAVGAAARRRRGCLLLKSKKANRVN